MTKEVNKVTNKEYWKDEIVDLVINGAQIDLVDKKPVLCKITSCNECDFHAVVDCGSALINWANLEYVPEKIQREVKNCKVDDKVLVSHDGKKFYREHFKSYNKLINQVETFTDGQTSWSGYTKGMCVGWEYAKLPDEMEE